VPLLKNAKAVIIGNLKMCQAGAKRPPIVQIGVLTASQLKAINERRIEDEMPEVNAEILFIGGHVYKSRVVQQGYPIEEVADQIENALSESSIVIDTPYMTAMQNPNSRIDKEGNEIQDLAIFECSTRFPRIELTSVVPKGDGKAKDKSSSK
jgi:hypothetical protein